MAEGGVSGVLAGPTGQAVADRCFNTLSRCVHVQVHWIDPVRWAREQFGPDLRWAIEDCRHLSARPERDLLTAGQAVVRVPPKIVAEHRRIARTRGKSDQIDALAVARAALRDPDLPGASHDDTSRELKLLVDRREDLVKTRTPPSTGCFGGSTSSTRPGRHGRSRWT